MIASIALEVFVLGLAVWQLIVVRRSMRADHEKSKAELASASDPPPSAGEGASRMRSGRGDRDLSG